MLFNILISALEGPIQYARAHGTYIPLALGTTCKNHLPHKLGAKYKKKIEILI